MGRVESLSIFARAALAAGRTGGAALLLEGSWPEGDREDAGQRLALDDLFDVRHRWIDDEAARVAEDLAQRGLAAGRQGWLPWLDNLKLRYVLVRLIRAAAFFQTCPLATSIGSIDLHLEGTRDEDYRLLLAEICRRDGIDLNVHSHPGGAVQLPALPANPTHRRIAGRLAALLGRWTPGRSPAGPRVLLCGNPGLIDPLCQGLLERGNRVGWLWDRFPVHCWKRWRGRVELLLCDAALGKHNGWSVDTWGPLVSQGVDLAGPVRHWLAIRAAHYGGWQTRLVARMDEHFARWRPDVLVLDEDSTPTARAAVAVAREHDVPSLVLQHGAPYVRFGYAPPAADRIAVWGETSRERFVSFGVPGERITVTGSPKHDALVGVRPAPLRSTDAPRALILATLPPADDRPDSVALHFTSLSHRGMLRAALGGLSTILGARIALKLHPRLAREQVFHEVLAEFPALDVELIQGGDLAGQVAESDLVLSCVSSAGMEAAWWGRPVIELLPVDSEEPLPAADWGLVGAARTAAEVAQLAREALARREPVAPSARVFANLERPAVERIAELIEEMSRTPAACSP